MVKMGREDLIKIKEFLEDIYMYLNNNIATKSHSTDENDDDEEESQRHETKRKELIENCKHIRSIFENEFHPHDVDSTISYLDMNGVTKNRIKSSVSDENEIAFPINILESSREEYVEMNRRKSANSRISENPYNIYEAAISLSNQDSEKCPFTGLPAVHLKLMCSPIAGLLTKLERKLFFGQSKDYYAGILDKWILLYPSKSNDMAPSEYFYPKSLQNVKGENRFIIVTNNDKRYHFQAPNSQEYNEWIENIKKIIEEIQNGKMRESQTPQLLSTRKLPSPPTTEKKEHNENDDIENYYSFGGAPQSINSNEERLYEEPCSSSFDDTESPPKLPKKIGKKVKEEDDGDHEYDTPKLSKIIEEPCPTIEVQDELQEDETQIKESVEQTDSSPNIPRIKVSEMTAMLSGINLISPEEKLRSNMIRTRKSQNVESSPSDIEINSKRKSPVKKWFRQTLMRGRKSFSQKEKIPNIEEHEVDEETNNKIVTSVKGSKVNMIINQLEKSGQMKALKKGLKSRKSLVYDNNEEYETVCVKNNKLEV